MKHVDVYMFPDPSAGNPAAQMSSLVQALANAGIRTRAAPPSKITSILFCFIHVGFFDFSRVLHSKLSPKFSHTLFLIDSESFGYGIQSRAAQRA